MYGWIWRRLPFGLPGRLIGSLILIGGICALLWYVVFPAVDPILPFNDVQVTAPSGQHQPSPPTSTPASPTIRPSSGNDLPGN